MPRVHVPITQLGTTFGTIETTPVVGDPVNGHYVENDGNVWLEMINTGGGTATVTVHPTPEAVIAYFLVDIVITLAPNETWFAGTFPAQLFTLLPQVLGTIYNEGNSGSTPIVPTPGTSSCLTFDVSSAGVSLRAYRLAG